MKKILMLSSFLCILYGIEAQQNESCITYSPSYSIVNEACSVTYSFHVTRECYSLIGSIYNVSWNFGDGNTSTDHDPNHTYSQPGIYTVSVQYTVNNNNYSASTTVSVDNFNNSMVDFHSHYEDGIVNFYFTGSNLPNNHCFQYSIDFGDGNSAAGILNYAPQGDLFASHQYEQGGSYIVSLEICICPSIPLKLYQPSTYCCFIHTETIEVESHLCCLNFAPYPGKKYWISAWVNVVIPEAFTYLGLADIVVVFEGSTESPITLHPDGEIIDGWQRIVGEFFIPEDTDELTLILRNPTQVFDAYFDDVRLHPWNSSMKSYVYDPENYRLVAELDDNNYATFYEYDNEGQLIRIKKETARGIMTIQESRSHSHIKN